MLTGGNFQKQIAPGSHLLISRLDLHTQDFMWNKLIHLNGNPQQKLFLTLNQGGSYGPSICFSRILLLLPVFFFYRYFF